MSIRVSIPNRPCGRAVLIPTVFASLLCAALKHDTATLPSGQRIQIDLRLAARASTISTPRSRGSSRSAAMLMRYFEHIAAAPATFKVAFESFCRSCPAACGRRASSGRTNLQSSPSKKAANIARDIRITPSAIVGLGSIGTRRPRRGTGRDEASPAPPSQAHHGRRGSRSAALQIRTSRDHRDARTARITRDSCSASMAISVRSTTSPIAISSLIAGT